MLWTGLTLAFTSLQVLDFNLGLQEQALFFLMLLLVRVVYYGVDLHTIISGKGLCTLHTIHKGVAHTCMPWSRVTTSGWVPASASCLMGTSGFHWWCGRDSLAWCSGWVAVAGSTSCCSLFFLLDSVLAFVFRILSESLGRLHLMRPMDDPAQRGAKTPSSTEFLSADLLLRSSPLLPFRFNFIYSVSTAA